MTKAIFLDRDGVLNQTVLKKGRPYPPASFSELVILPGVPEACLALKKAGYRLIMVTNQPDIARGTQSPATVDQINTYLQSELRLDEVRVCPHDDADHCACRKPQPGLLLATPDIDLARSFLVGDRWRDIEAGHRARVRAIWIDYHYAEPRPTHPHHTVKSLAQAADWILNLSGVTNEY